MLKLDPENSSLVDMSPIIEASHLTWREVTLKLRPHPLNLIKSSIKYYSAISHITLSKILTPVDDLFPIFEYNEDERKLLVHVGLIPACIKQLDIDDHYGGVFRECISRSKSIGKKVEYLDRLEKADELLSDESLYNYITIYSLSLSDGIFEELMTYPYEPDRELGLHDYKREIVEEILNVVRQIVGMELEICGGKSKFYKLWRV